MFKIVIVSGPSRGTSYVLKEGKFTMGRQQGNQAVLASSKVSKKHCQFKVEGNSVLFEDLGSSNGSFVNGSLTKQKVLKVGDRISVGEYIFELTELAVIDQFSPPPAVQPFFPQQRSQPIAGVSSADPLLVSAPPRDAPQDLVTKALAFFEYQVMPYFYRLNLKYEWKWVGAAAVGIILAGNLLFSVSPLLESGRQSVVQEVKVRARYMAREIAEKNAPFLANRMETKTEIGSVENAEGVVLAILIDLDNRIIAPAVKANQYLESGGEAIYAVKMAKKFREGREEGASIEFDTNRVVAVEPIKVLSGSLGKNVVVGMVLVSIDASIVTPNAGEMGVVYSETLILSGLLASLVALIFYKVTLKSFLVLNDDLDKVLKGELTQVTKEFQFKELDSLFSNINSALLRIPKKSNAGLEFSSEETVKHQIEVEDLVDPLARVAQTLKLSFVFLDHDKKILSISSSFEELTGIRLESARGKDLQEVARDQSFGVFVTELLSSATSVQSYQEEFDFSGIVHKVTAFPLSSAGMLKGFLIFAFIGEGA